VVLRTSAPAPDTGIAMSTGKGVESRNGEPETDQPFSLHNSELQVFSWLLALCRHALSIDEMPTCPAGSSRAAIPSTDERSDQSPGMRRPSGSTQSRLGSIRIQKNSGILQAALRTARARPDYAAPPNQSGGHP